jgi:hypothetical protein
MKVNANGDKKTRKSQTVTDPLHQGTSGTESRRSDIDTAVPVDDGSNGDIDSCYDEVADPDDSEAETLLPHLGDDGEADNQPVLRDGRF